MESGIPGTTAGRGAHERVCWWLALDGVVAAAVAVAVAAVLVPGPVFGLDGRRWVLAASTGFVLLGVLSLIRTRRLMAVPMAVGLGHCWLGDFLGPVDFTLGGIAFLVGHLWFVAGFCLQGVAWRRSLAAVGVLAIAGTGIGSWLLPHVQDLDRTLVVSYMTVISLMVAAAAGTRGGGARLALLGACLFYVSDIVVADWRFVHSGVRHDLFCYPLYYAACVLLALWPQASAGRQTPPRAAASAAAAAGAPPAAGGCGTEP